MIIKRKREAIVLRQVYAKSILNWTKKVNELLIKRKMVKESATCLGLVVFINFLDSVDAGAIKLVLLVSDQEVSTMQMSRLLEALKTVQENLRIIDEWSNPQRRARAPETPLIEIFHLEKLNNVSPTNLGLFSDF